MIHLVLACLTAMYPSRRAAAEALPNSNSLGNELACSNRSSLDSSSILHPLQGSSSMPQPPSFGSLPRTPCNGVARTHVYAIDQVSTKLKIPMSAVQPTLALEDDGFVPGLCRLFLAGRCRQDANCYQVHADPAVVEQLRVEAFRKPSCCVEHGACCSMKGFPVGLTVTVEPSRKLTGKPHKDAIEDDLNGPSADSSSASNGDSNSVGNEENTAAPRGVGLSIHSFSPTSYLWKAYRADGSANLVVSCRKICRMHRQGLCRFGDECNFLHVCRQIPLDFLDDCDTDYRSPLTPLGSQSPPRKDNNNGSNSFRGTQGGGGGRPLTSHFTSSSMPSRTRSFAAFENGPQMPRSFAPYHSSSQPTEMGPTSWGDGAPSSFRDVYPQRGNASGKGQPTQLLRPMVKIASFPQCMQVKTITTNHPYSTSSISSSLQ